MTNKIAKTGKGNIKYIEANRGQRFADMENKSRLKLMSDLIALTVYRAGQSTENTDEIKALTVDAVGIIDRHFATVRPAEIKAAFENGVIGTYGQYFGINTKTFAEWIRAYLNDEARKKAVIKHLNALNTPQTLPDDVKTRLLDEAYMRKLNEYKAQSKCNDYGNAVYNYLDSLGMIDFTAQQKHDFMNRAQEILERGKKKRRNAETEIENDQQNPVVRLAKKLALNKYFEMITG